jgi:hypothetical protein
MDDVERKIALAMYAREQGVAWMQMSDVGMIAQRDYRRFDLDKSLPLIYGVSDDELLTKMQAAKDNPGNRERFEEFVVAIVGPAAERGQFGRIILRSGEEGITPEFTSTPQLPSTVYLSSGIAAQTAGMIALGHKFHERTIFSMDGVENFGEKY